MHPPEHQKFQSGIHIVTRPALLLQNKDFMVYTYTEKGMHEYIFRLEDIRWLLIRDNPVGTPKLHGLFYKVNETRLEKMKYRDNLASPGIRLKLDHSISLQC